MQGFTVTAITNAEETKTSTLMSNFDVNVDRRTDGRTNGRTEIWTPISHPAISRCDKNTQTQSTMYNWSCIIVNTCVCSFQRRMCRYPSLELPVFMFLHFITKCMNWSEPCQEGGPCEYLRAKCMYS